MGHLQDAGIGVQLQHGQSVDGVWVDGIESPHIQEPKRGQGCCQRLQIGSYPGLNGCAILLEGRGVASLNIAASDNSFLGYIACPLPLQAACAGMVMSKRLLPFPRG